jgi:hypothetical protein
MQTLVITQCLRGASIRAPLTKAYEAAEKAQETILKREYDGVSADAPSKENDVFR